MALVESSPVGAGDAFGGMSFLRCVDESRASVALGPRLVTAAIARDDEAAVLGLSGVEPIASSITRVILRTGAFRGARSRPFVLGSPSTPAWDVLEAFGAETGRRP